MLPQTYILFQRVWTAIYLMVDPDFRKAAIDNEKRTLEGVLNV
jgi:hypothetical protein